MALTFFTKALIKLKIPFAFLEQVEAQLWTPTGKLPKLPPVSQSQPTASAANDLKLGGGQNNRLSESELKDRTIEKLKAECAKLSRRATHFQDQANDSKVKMEKIVKNLSSLFGEDQVRKNFLIHRFASLKTFCSWSIEIVVFT